MSDARHCRGPVAGYVMAGGRSARMGRDKARLPWKGRTLIEVVCSEVKAATGCVTTVGGEALPNIRHIDDPLAGFGPVAGITAALRDSDCPWSLVVACDMPGIEARLLQALLDAAAGDAAVALTPDGRVHPLCAVWSAASLRTFEQALADREHTLRRVVERLHCVFPTVDASLVRNVNTPEEYADALAAARE